MSVIADASIRINPETRFFARDVGRQLSGPLKSVFGKIAGTAAAAFAGVKVLRFFGDSFKEAQEARKVFKLTAAVIKSTGGVAGVTAKHVDDLATSISNLTGIDDELVASAENVLLTFTNVGGPVFDQATKAAVDLSAALGQDLQSSVIQIGKALNDPIKGVTALRRVGVSFTAAQLKQIKALQLNNDLLGAQKIILGELNKEFGGAAEAAATPWDKMKVALQNLEENIGTALLPFLDKIATFISTKVVPAISGWVASISAPGGLLDDIGAVLKALGPAALSLIQAFWQGFTSQDAKNAKQQIHDTAEEQITLNDVITAFNEDVLPPLRDGFRDFGANVKLTIHLISTFVGWIVGAGIQAEHVVRDVIGAFEWLGARFVDIIDTLIEAWNSLDFGIDFTLPSWIPGIGGKGIHIKDLFPDIPLLAEGGLVTQPTLAMLAERRKPEAIIPLDKLPEIISASLNGMDQRPPVQQTFITQARDERVLANEIAYRMGREAQR